MSTASSQEGQRSSGDQPPQKARPPFDKPTANVIIRSSTNVDFYVQKAIMQEASPVFEDMFSLPQPSASTGSRKRKEREEDLFVDGIPVVKVTEDADTLHHLLLYCYPTKPLTPAKDELLFKVLEASSKYMMDGITQQLFEILRPHIMRSPQPLHLYFLAVKHRSKEGITLAARACLGIDLTTPSYQDPLMESISAGAYIRLLVYYQKCHHVGMRVLRDQYLCDADAEGFDWRSFLEVFGAPPYLTPCIHSRHASAGSRPVIVANGFGGNHKLMYACSWFLPYVDTLAKAFAKRPRAGTIENSDFSECIVESAKLCPECFNDVPGELDFFREKLAEYIESEQRKIEIEIVF